MRVHETIILESPLYPRRISQEELRRLRRVEVERQIAEHERLLGVLREELTTLGGDAA